MHQINSFWIIIKQKKNETLFLKVIDCMLINLNQSICAELNDPTMLN